tara:strand:- start:110 stop:424 length:315 start_codon:yes stop_codon:yes gene_type:complete
MAKSFKRGNNTKKENNKSGKPTKPVIVASNRFEYFFRKWSSKYHFIENNRFGKSTRTIIVASNWHSFYRKLNPENSDEEISLWLTEDYERGLPFKWFKTIEVKI